MTSRTIFEIIGYVGSALVLLSFLMSSVLKLRIINSIGSLASLIYGLLVHTYPTVIMNGALLIINIVFIIIIVLCFKIYLCYTHVISIFDKGINYISVSHILHIVFCKSFHLYVLLSLHCFKYPNNKNKKYNCPKNCCVHIIPLCIYS